MDTRPIELNDKAAIEGLRTRCGHKAASHAFASLYIWRREMQLSLCLWPELFAVKTALHGPNAWFFPCGSRAAVCEFLAQLLAESEPVTLCYMRAEDCVLVEQEFPGRFTIREKPEDSEYLYDRQEQEAMAGKKYARLRNHVRRAERDHTLTVEHLGPCNMAAAAGVLRAWEAQPHETGELGLADDDAPYQLLAAAEPLNLSGVMVSVEGEPFSIVAGYPLADDTFDMCLAKQKEMLPGLSVFTKHAFVQMLPPECRVINAEEDLGIDGLRTMKRQMQPMGQITMFEGRTSRGNAE